MYIQPVARHGVTPAPTHLRPCLGRGGEGGVGGSQQLAWDKRQPQHTGVVGSEVIAMVRDARPHTVGLCWVDLGRRRRVSLGVALGEALGWGEADALLWLRCLQL